MNARGLGKTLDPPAWDMNYSIPYLESYFKSRLNLHHLGSKLHPNGYIVGL
jgi:hypothetical protein